MRKPRNILEEIQEELDIYSEDNVEDLIEDDAISAAEAGFMMGYLSA